MVIANTGSLEEITFLAKTHLGPFTIVTVIIKVIQFCRSLNQKIFSKNMSKNLSKKSVEKYSKKYAQKIFEKKASKALQG